MKRSKKIVLMLIITVMIAISILLFFMFRGETINTEVAKNNGEKESIESIQEKLEEKSWHNSIVNDIVEDDIPVPVGYKYLQGDKNTGLVIEEIDSQSKYLFIPYQENLTTDMSQYFENAECYEMDYKTVNSIKKYNGFFVNLNSDYKISDLKKMDNEKYETLVNEADSKYEQDISVNGHILYKEEIAQINNYINNNNLTIDTNSIGINALAVESFADVNVGAGVGKDDRTVYIYSPSSGIYENKNIPIPVGFKYSVDNKGIVTIEDKDNKNLVYVWVPYISNKESGNKSAKDYRVNKILNEIYGKSSNPPNKDSEQRKIWNESEPTSYSKTSTKTSEMERWGGMWVSQAELGYTEDGKFCNVARGMVDYTVTKTKDGGDYYRGSTTSGLTYNKMNSIAQDVAEEEHNITCKTWMMSGIDWMDTLIWIAETNPNYRDSHGNNIYNVLASDSRYVGKYKDSELKATSAATDVKFLNGLWGLGGNLAELTDEKYNGQRIIRGGSWANTGEGAPIASMKPINENSSYTSDEIGFRVVLTISENAKPVFNVGDQEEPDNPSNVSKEDLELKFLQMENNGKNMIYSPLSIKYGLKMMETSAKGNTLTQIKSVVGDKMPTKYKNIDKKLSLANGIFINNKYTGKVQTNYKNNLVQSFNAEVIYDNFTNSNNINKWVQDKTLGLIKDMFGNGVNPNTNLLLINALAIDLDWKQKFDVGYTTGATFNLNNGQKMEAATMKKTVRSADISYYLTDSITALGMELEKVGNTQLEFVAIMPKEDLNQYISTFNKAKLDGVLKSLKSSMKASYGIEIEIPKFKFDYNLNLKKDLQSLGITDAFNPSLADFSNITGNKSLFVEDALHKATIKLDENGVKAAATTSISYISAVIPKERPKLKFDKPFLFIIRDKNLNEVWFTGTVYQPDKWVGR